jgi:ADP-ribose pyrophosphatase
MATEGEVLLVTRRFRVVRHLQATPDGKIHPRETVEHPGAVAILPLLDGDRVCLIRNYRVSVGKVLIELPAGTLDSDEDPLHTARRELIEETGYRAAQIRPLCQFFMSPGILSERMHLFLATGLQSGPMALEAGEEIEPLVVPWDHAIEMAVNGTIEDAKTLVGLLYYDRMRSGADANRPQ